MRLVRWHLPELRSTQPWVVATLAALGLLVAFAGWNLYTASSTKTEPAPHTPPPRVTVVVSPLAPSPGRPGHPGRRGRPGVVVTVRPSPTTGPRPSRSPSPTASRTPSPSCTPLPIVDRCPPGRSRP